jgi:hypothetical protein
MKSFARLLLATLAMTTALALSLMKIYVATALILFVSALAYTHFGLIQALAAMVFTASLAITALMHWDDGF